MLFKSHYADFLLYNHIPTVSKILRRSEAKKSPYTHHKGSRGMDPLILKLGIRKRRVVKFTFGPIFDLKERRHALNTNIEYVSPTACLDILETREITWPCRDSNPVTSSPQPSHYNDYTRQCGLMYVFYTQRRRFLASTVVFLITSNLAKAARRSSHG